MARAYPRFLFANPKNTKSEGPFIVHCLQPRLIFKINESRGHFAMVPFIGTVLDEYDFSVELADTALNGVLPGTAQKISNEAAQWLTHQIKTGAITL